MIQHVASGPGHPGSHSTMYLSSMVMAMNEASLMVQFMFVETLSALFVLLILVVIV